MNSLLDTSHWSLWGWIIAIIALCSVGGAVSIFRQLPEAIIEGISAYKRWVALQEQRQEWDEEDRDRRRAIEDETLFTLDENESIIDDDVYDALKAKADRYDAIMKMARFSVMNWTGLSSPTSPGGVAPLPDAEGKVSATIKFQSHPDAGHIATDEFSMQVFEALVDASVIYRQSQEISDE